MLGSLLLTEWQRNELTGICGYWIAPLSEAHRNRCVDEILACFHAWKESQTNASGTVRVSTNGGGLLALRPTSEFLPAVEVTPWQCAGPDVRDEIGLAFHLWFESFVPFQALILDHGLAPIFALTGAMSWSDAMPESLIRLNGFLTHLLVGEARESANDAGKHRNSTRHLPIARAASVKTRKDRSSDLFAKAHQMAVDYRREHADADENQIIRYLRKFEAFSVWKGESNLRRAIKGSLSSLRRDVDTNRPTRKR